MRRSTFRTHTFDWSKFAVFLGAEEGETGDAGDAGSAPDGTGSPSSETPPPPDPEEASTDEDTSGLKSALQKEREARKAAEREARRLKAEVDRRADEEKSEIERATERAKKSEERVKALATRYREAEVNSAITRAATGMRFRDMDDAIRLVDRSAFGVEQDEDNPAEVTIDEKSVTLALQALAKAKPHLLIAEGADDPSGSTFGRKKDKATLDEEALKKKYPALNS